MTQSVGANLISSLRVWVGVVSMGLALMAPAALAQPKNVMVFAAASLKIALTEGQGFFVLNQSAARS